MKRLTATGSLRIAAVLLIGAQSYAAEPPPMQKNPFTRPPSAVIVDSHSPIPVDSVSAKAIDLRATLVAPRESLANVGGKVLRPGDIVQGYQLLRVYEDRADFTYHGRPLTVYVRPQAGENDD